VPFMVEFVCMVTIPGTWLSISCCVSSMRSSSEEIVGVGVGTSELEEGVVVGKMDGT